jgi:hypothetical protein
MALVLWLSADRVDGIYKPSEHEPIRLVLEKARIPYC